MTAHCPACDEPVRVPTEAVPGVELECPWCRNRFDASEVLAALPPELQIVSATRDSGSLSSHPQRGSSERLTAESWLPPATSPSVESEVAEMVREVEQWESHLLEEVEEEPSGELAVESDEEAGEAEEGFELPAFRRQTPPGSLDFGNDPFNGSRLHTMPRRVSGVSPVKLLAQWVGGGVAGIALAVGILYYLDRVPELGFWPFDGSLRSASSQTNRDRDAPPAFPSPTTAETPAAAQEAMESLGALTEGPEALGEDAAEPNEFPTPREAEPPAEEMPAEEVPADGIPAGEIPSDDAALEDRPAASGFDDKGLPDFSALGGSDPVAEVEEAFEAPASLVQTDPPSLRIPEVDPPVLVPQETVRRRLGTARNTVAEVAGASSGDPVKLAGNGRRVREDLAALGAALATLGDADAGVLRETTPQVDTLLRALRTDLPLMRNVLEAGPEQFRQLRESGGNAGLVAAGTWETIEGQPQLRWRGEQPLLLSLSEAIDVPADGSRVIVLGSIVDGFDGPGLNPGHVHVLAR